MQIMFTIFNTEYSANTGLYYPGLRSSEGAGITFSAGLAVVCKPFAGNTGICVLATETSV